MTNSMSWFTDKKRSLQGNKTEMQAALPHSSKKSLSSQFLYFVGPLLFFPWWIKTPKGKREPIHQHSWPDSQQLNGFIDSLFCSTLCVTLAQAVHTRRIKMALFYFKLLTTETSQTWTEVAEFQNKHVQNFYSFACQWSFPRPMPLGSKALS